MQINILIYNELGTMPLITYQLITFAKKLHSGFIGLHKRI